MKESKPIKTASKKRLTAEELDKEVTRLGISRQALIKVWIAECLDRYSCTAGGGIRPKS